MRLLLAVAVVTTLALPASAQTHLSDSSGAYLSFNDLGVEWSQSRGLTGGMGGVLGYRQANGLDYGLQSGYRVSDLSRTLSLGVQAGYTKPLDTETFLRLEGATRLGRSEVFRRGYTYDASTLATTMSLRLGREFRLVGSFRVTPSVGVYAASYHSLSFETTAENPTASPDGHSLGVGPLVEIPLSFRLLGRDVAVGNTLGVSVLGDVYVDPLTNGPILRINF